MSNNDYGANLAKETLTGDIAAFLIDRLRQFPKPYQQMSEAEQTEQIEQAKTAAKELVRKAVNIVASGGRRVVQAELGKITINNGLKAEIKANTASADELISVQGRPILIVTNGDDEFSGGEDKLKADPDQREMFENCNEEYQEADGQGISEPVALLPVHHSDVVDTEFEEIDDSEDEED